VLPAERHHRILAMLVRGGVVGTEDLAKSLRVSSETVRRDLKLLERQRTLARVHGGATSVFKTGQEPPYLDRAGIAPEAKTAIGRCAAQLVQPGMSVMIDVGTTTLEVARALPEDYRGLVVTCSVVAAIELVGRAGVEVIVSGGRLRTGDMALSNHLTVQFFKDLRPDIAFLGSGGIDESAGLTDFHLDEVITRRVVLAQATQSYVLADSSKHGRVATHRVCGLDGFTGLITDRMPSAGLAAGIKRSGGQVIVAS